MKRVDGAKVLHPSVKKGKCLDCHAAHVSERKGLVKASSEQLCVACHQIEPLFRKPVRHAPVAEGRCLDCHEAHGGDTPAFVRAGDKALCLSCHDEKAPRGKGTPSAARRVDLDKKTVHGAVKKSECSGCHSAGHGADHAGLLRSPLQVLCQQCHPRTEQEPYVHSAVVVSDCAVCHDPHASDHKKLMVAEKDAAVCFRCHQDDVTGRAFVHAPVTQGCQDCHGAHGAPNRMVLTVGAGKQACYACHEVLDKGKVRHAPLDRYGCVGCHDPHASGNRFMLGKKTNDLCISCHPEQKDGKHVTATIAKGHPVGGMMDPRRDNHEFTCATCHNPHGSNSPKLFYVGSSPMESCAGCHGDKSGKRPDLKNVISRAKPLPPGSAGGGGAGGGGAGGGGGGGGGGNVPSTGESLTPAARARYGITAGAPARAASPETK
jgi:predicted CXXCH cytochrome family protein